MKRLLDTAPRQCCCVGPQNGQPVCPCAMRGVSVRNGRYVREEDLGPVSDPADPRTWDKVLRESFSLKFSGRSS